MDNWLLYLLIVIAIATGWWLGRRERARNGDAVPVNYYQGLNHLLNEEPDRAVATFIEDLEVNADTLETHLALGALLRRRGELEKAVVVHENILNRTSLDNETIQNVQLELARDYLLAGLLDRAEELSVKLGDASSGVRHDSYAITLEIYEREKEWHQAIEVAQLLAVGDESEFYERRISHYYCEIAEDLLRSREYSQARHAISDAIGHDANNPRTSLIQGRIDLEENRYDDAIRVLQRIRRQDPVYLAESLVYLTEAYEKGNRPPAELRDYLLEALEIQPSISIVLTIAELLRAEFGDEAMAAFVSDHLKKYPTIRGLARFVDLYIDETEGVARDILSILRSFAAALVADKPAYRCENCGFEGKKMRWHCPSCKEWGSIAPIYGLEGE